MIATKPCNTPGCPNLQPCPTPGHAPKPWAGNNGRRGRTRSGSREQRINRAVMLQHEGVCHVCGQPGADQVDHVIALTEGGDDTIDNRRPIHAEPCHRVKTAKESARARNR